MRNWNRQQLRLALGGFFLALVVPTVMLIAKAYGQLRWESFHLYQQQAAELAGRINEAIRERIRAEEARASGATVATGGSLTDDGVLRPTVIANASPDLKVCSQEVFGPVVAVTAYDTLDEAIALANDTKFGLQAAIFTSDINKALKAVRSLDFGGVLVNEVPTWRADQQPYGGLRDSGNTREGPAYSVREMTEIRMVVLG